MSTPIVLKVTAAGRTAQLNARGTGFLLDLSHIQFGTGHRTPDGSETALIAAQQAKSFSAGNKPIPTQMRVSVVMPGVAVYAVNEIGVWAGAPGGAGSVLYAYWSSAATTVANMAVGQDLVLSFDMTLDDGDGINIVVDPVEAALYALITNHEASGNPHAQYVRVDAIATQAQAEAGTNNTAWMTPLRVKQAIDNLVPYASESLIGKSRLATDAETLAGASRVLSVHPAAMVAAINSMVPAASETAVGKARFATSAEAIAAVSKVLGVTPFSAAALVDARVPLANETTIGKVRLATPTETQAGASAAIAVHPAAMMAAINAVVNSAINALVNGSPAALNQLNELAAAIGNDANFATSVANALATKLTKAQGDGYYDAIGAATAAKNEVVNWVNAYFSPIHAHPYDPAGSAAAARAAVWNDAVANFSQIGHSHAINLIDNEDATYAPYIGALQVSGMDITVRRLAGDGAGGGGGCIDSSACNCSS